MRILYYTGMLLVLGAGVLSGYWGIPWLKYAALSAMLITGGALMGAKAHSEVDR